MISAIIITKNEENNIADCLNSISWVDEIVLVDSGSTDATLTIAQKFNVKIIKKSWLGFGPQKQFALEHTSHDWVLNIDADEIISEKLALEIKSKLSSDPKIIAWKIPIQMHFYGRNLKYSLATKRHIRLFKKQYARYSGDMVHEKILLAADAKISTLKNIIIHKSYADLSEALNKLNYYSSITASNRLKHSKNRSFIAVLLSSFWIFIRCYFLQRGFIDGKEGLLLAIYFSHGSFYRGMKTIYVDQDDRINENA